MEELTFEKLDVNEWCEVAKSWGAQEVNFMLAHSGGFCTHGSDDTPVKNGKEATKITAVRLKKLHERLGSDDVVEIWLDLPRFLSVGKAVKEYSPNAVIQAVGCPEPLPTIRWPGTESGTVKDPCWSTTNRSNLGGAPLALSTWGL